MNDENESYEFDPDVQVEMTPGYLGYVFDDYFKFGPELETLFSFDWKQYESMAIELKKDNRHLVVDLGDQKIDVKADAFKINEFLDHLPSVEAIYDCPQDQGPAGGSGYVFVASNSYYLEHDKIRSHAVALKKALEEDYEILRQEFISSPEIQKYYQEHGIELPKPLLSGT